MKNLNCHNCGAPMRLDVSGMTAVCSYCGTEYVLNHEDTDYFQRFYYQMGHLLAIGEDEQERRKQADALWQRAEEISFSSADGGEIAVRYLYQFRTEDTEVYIARRNIIFRFLKNWEQKALDCRKGVAMLDYPSADTRSLSDFFPQIAGGYALTDNTGLLVLQKEETEYPLCLFGRLPGRHVAWIISRMENLCCVLEYSHLVHPRFGMDTLYINPYTHQASLYGHFWNVVKNNTPSGDHRSVYTTRDNLTALRHTAAQLLGYPKAGMVQVTEDVPQALADFLNQPPKNTAYEDFALWDEMLIKAYGERKFIRMQADDATVYGKKE